MRAIKILGIILFSILFTQNSFSQKKEKKILEAEIKTTAICGMCKDRIEKILAYEKGIKSSEVDYKTGIVKVKYKSHKTDINKIREAIANAGYNADDVKKNEEAYKKLPDCCKKEKEKKSCCDKKH
ncbi:MAG: hypothetical protein B6I24_01370 [Bacteroidetes bacterium 4572_128]|nr:MAG: hypothetical protein B6I24_01370 [Bacteroidetes bacterium 4572_128]